MPVKQIPVDYILAGVYSWTLRLDQQTITGNVIVRGSKADPIGDYDFPANSETWYYESIESQGNSEQSFELTLVMMAEPSDEALDGLVGQVVSNGTKMGTASITPDWQEGSPLPEEPVVFTMTAVKQGPGEYDELYHRVSMVMPVDGEPLMPTWYTDIEGLFSIFGGNEEEGAPIADGIRASFEEVGPEDDGYPGEGWYWAGREPG